MALRKEMEAMVPIVWEEVEVVAVVERDSKRRHVNFKHWEGPSSAA